MGTKSFSYDRMIGIDAGGSNTRVVVVSREELEADEIVDSEVWTIGPANYRTFGEPGIRSVIRYLSADGRIDEPHRTFLVGGFAGAGSPDDRELITNLFEIEGFRKDALVVTSDAGLLLMAMGGNGIVLIAGTGSICAASHRIDPDRWGNIDIRAGGYGDRIPSEAGGYRLGIEAIDAVLRIEDGREKTRSALDRYVRDHFEVNDLREVISILYPMEEKERNAVPALVAGLAGRVLQAAYEGDRIARKLVEETARDLVDLVLAVLIRMEPGENRIGLYGGLFADRHGEELLIGPLRNLLEEKGHDLTYVRFGIREGDPDPLKEAMKAVFARQRKGPI